MEQYNELYNNNQDLLANNLNLQNILNKINAHIEILDSMNLPVSEVEILNIYLDNIEIYVLTFNDGTISLLSLSSDEYSKIIDNAITGSMIYINSNNSWLTDYEGAELLIKYDNFAILKIIDGYASISFDHSLE